ncbi:nucleic acid binding / methyltransferase isoform X2 [Wolffia australiana]
MNLAGEEINATAAPPPESSRIQDSVNESPPPESSRLEDSVNEAPPPESSGIEDSDDDDAPPSLSARALQALREFLNERQEKEGSLDDALDDAMDDAVELVSEDWRLSQFWYEPETARTVAEEVLAIRAVAGSSCNVACVSCPTIYAYLKFLHLLFHFFCLKQQKMDPDLPAHVLEFDERFEQYGSDFIFYDYNQPIKFPSAMHHAYQIVIADPPYLSQECLEKVAETVSFLARTEESFLLLLTVQEERAAELLNVRPCRFQPRHCSKLGNEFCLFTSYNPQERLGGWAL